MLFSLTTIPSKTKYSDYILVIENVSLRNVYRKLSTKTLGTNLTEAETVVELNNYKHSTGPAGLATCCFSRADRHTKLGKKEVGVPEQQKKIRDSFNS